jgi:hypothetical protein
MTFKLGLFWPEQMAPDTTSAGLVEISRPSEIHNPFNLAEEFPGEGERIRDGLQKMNALHIEIGRELRAVRERLSRSQFFCWVASACGVPPRTARSMMRAAEEALSASSTAQKRVQPRPAQGQKPTAYVVKNLTNAARVKASLGLSAGRQGDGERTLSQSQCKQPQMAPLEADGTKAELLLPAMSQVTAAELGEPAHAA